MRLFGVSSGEGDVVFEESLVRIGHTISSSSSSSTIGVRLRTYPNSISDKVGEARANDAILDVDVLVSVNRVDSSMSLINREYHARSRSVDKGKGCSGVYLVVVNQSIVNVLWRARYR